jgi:hypothetical protein
VEHSNLEYLRKRIKVTSCHYHKTNIFFVAWKHKNDLWDVKPCSLVNAHDILEDHAASTFKVKEKTEH